MLVAVAAAIAAAASTSAVAASDPPLREVVYHVSYTNHQRLIGHDMLATDEGTITVDVMAVSGDTLGVRLVESWKQNPHGSATYVGNIGPDGAFHFGNQTIGEAAAVLLPAFGPRWTQGEPLESGAKWTASADGPDVNVTSRFEVLSSDGDTATIEENETIEADSLRGMRASASGKITYKPGLLVPLAIEFERRSLSDDADAGDYELTFINIERISDTLDPTR